MSADEIRADVFGYTLVNDWRARRPTALRSPRPKEVPISIGPCVVTADDLDPQTMFVKVKVDEHECSRET